jgi:hypothetical protein
VEILLKRAYERPGRRSDLTRFRVPFNVISYFGFVCHRSSPLWFYLRLVAVICSTNFQVCTHRHSLTRRTLWLNLTLATGHSDQRTMLSALAVNRGTLVVSRPITSKVSFN